MYLLLSGTGIRAQSGPEGGGNELQVWTGGGHGLNGSTSDTGVWNLGVRYGWVLTDAVGPGPLRADSSTRWTWCRYFLLTQRNGTAYGIGLNPFALKWNFAAGRTVTPYVDLGGARFSPTRKFRPGRHE